MTRKTIASLVLALILTTFSISEVNAATRKHHRGAHHRHHHHVRHHVHHRRHDSVEARVMRSQLVANINAKLHRWVRPSGLCRIGETETLTTYYNSGRRTANGERFHPMGLTAAHRSLVFGTTLHVRNPKSGMATSVRVNDRGPFTHAKLDLAEGAARAIGMRTSLYLCVVGI